MGGEKKKQIYREKRREEYEARSRKEAWNEGGSLTGT